MMRSNDGGLSHFALRLVLKPDEIASIWMGAGI
jgi:hypothetical protein